VSSSSTLGRGHQQAQQPLHMALTQISSMYRATIYAACRAL
jgi:hypothetical protein